MKILHVIPNLVKGGAQRIALDLCTELSKNPNNTVKLIYFEGNNEFEFLTKYLSIERINISFKLGMFTKNDLNLTAYEACLDAFLPDIVHTHLYQAELIAHENPRDKVQYITHCHDNMRQFNTFNWKTPRSKVSIVEFWERLRLFRRYKTANKTFISISTDGEEFLKHNLPKALRKSSCLISNGFNFNAFYSPTKDNISRPIRLINVGNFIPKKNQQFLVQVMKELSKSDHFSFELHFIGEGETLEEVKNIAKSQKLTNLHFLGKQDDVKYFLTQSDIYVHSALYEPFGLVLLEAMSAGLPVVSLNGKGNIDIIEDNKNGFLVEQNDLTGFVDKILALASSPTTYSQIARNGQNTAKEFDIAIYSQKILNLYNHVIRRG